MQPTSLIAQRDHEASGNAETNRRRVLNLVAIYDGYTSRELAREAKSLIGPLMDLQEVRRRLTDLKDDNLVHNKGHRRNRINNKLELTWYYGGPNGENITDTTNAGVVS